MDRTVMVGEFEYELGVIRKNAAPRSGEGNLEDLGRHCNEHFWGKGGDAAAVKKAYVPFITKKEKSAKVRESPPDLSYIRFREGV